MPKNERHKSSVFYKHLPNKRLDLGSVQLLCTLYRSRYMVGYNIAINKSKEVMEILYFVDLCQIELLYQHVSKNNVCLDVHEKMLYNKYVVILQNRYNKGQ